MRWTLMVAAIAAWSLSMPAAGADTLKQIKQRGEFRIGYREATEPFSFADADGNAAGYSVELCQRIGAAVKEELKLIWKKVVDHES